MTHTAHQYQETALVRYINRVHPCFLTFATLCLCCLSYVPKGNEEQYLLYARQHFNPTWIAGSLMASEFPGTRWLFELLFGWMTDWLGFEKTIFIGRLLNYILMAIPLGALFRLLKFSTAQLLIILVVFIISGQRFFGGEWIFGDLETKIFAYVFVFWGLLKFLKRAYYKAFGFIVLATYFHILVGGWFAISCLLALFFQKANWKKIIQLGLYYSIPLIPFLIYLGKHMLAESTDFGEGVNLNHIYVYFRNRHHIGLFYNLQYFFEQHFAGVLASATAFFAYLRFGPYPNTVEWKTIKSLMLVMLGIGLFFVGVSLADFLFFNLSGGFLLKSYPFRMQSLAYLFFLMLTLRFLSIYPKTRRLWQQALPILLIVSMISLLIKCGLNIRAMANYQRDSAYNEVIDFINSHTPKAATLLVLNSSSTESHQNEFAVDLMRRTARENFVHFKVVPSTPAKMYEWYRRLQIVQALKEQPARLKEVRQQYSIDYLLTTKNLHFEEEEVFENEQFKIYKLH